MSEFHVEVEGYGDNGEYCKVGKTVTLEDFGHTTAVEIYKSISRQINLGKEYTSFLIVSIRKVGGYNGNS